MNIWRRIILVVLTLSLLSCKITVQDNVIRFPNNNVIKLKKSIDPSTTESVRDNVYTFYKEECLNVEEWGIVFIYGYKGFLDSEYSAMNLTGYNLWGELINKIDDLPLIHTTLLAKKRGDIVLLYGTGAIIYSKILNKKRVIVSESSNSYYLESGITEDEKFVWIIKSDIPRTIIDADDGFEGIIQFYDFNGNEKYKGMIKPNIKNSIWVNEKIYEVKFVL